MQEELNVLASFIMDAYNIFTYKRPDPRLTDKNRP